MGTKNYKVSPSMVPFESANDVKDADRRVADRLKEIFAAHLPKVEIEEEEGDVAMKADAAKSDDDDDGLFGSDEKKDEVPAKKLRKTSSIEPTPAAGRPESKPAEEESKVQGAAQSSGEEDDIF